MRNRLLPLLATLVGCAAALPPAPAQTTIPAGNYAYFTDSTLQILLGASFTLDEIYGTSSPYALTLSTPQQYGLLFLYEYSTSVSAVTVHDTFDYHITIENTASLPDQWAFAVRLDPTAVSDFDLYFNGNLTLDFLVTDADTTSGALLNSNTNNPLTTPLTGSSASANLTFGGTATVTLNTLSGAALRNQAHSIGGSGGAFISFGSDTSLEINATDPISGIAIFNFADGVNSTANITFTSATLSLNATGNANGIANFADNATDSGNALASFNLLGGSIASVSTRFLYALANFATSASAQFLVEASSLNLTNDASDPDAFALVNNASASVASIPALANASFLGNSTATFDATAASGILNNATSPNDADATASLILQGGSLEITAARDALLNTADSSTASTALAQVDLRSGHTATFNASNPGSGNAIRNLASGTGHASATLSLDNASLTANGHLTALLNSADNTYSSASITLNNASRLNLNNASATALLNSADRDASASIEIGNASDPDNAPVVTLNSPLANGILNSADNSASASIALNNGALLSINGFSGNALLNSAGDYASAEITIADAAQLAVTGSAPIGNAFLNTASASGASAEITANGHASIRFSGSAENAFVNTGPHASVSITGDSALRIQNASLSTALLNTDSASFQFSSNASLEITGDAPGSITNAILNSASANLSFSDNASVSITNATNAIQNSALLTLTDSSLSIAASNNALLNTASTFSASNSSLSLDARETALLNTASFTLLDGASLTIGNASNHPRSALINGQGFNTGSFTANDSSIILNAAGTAFDNYNSSVSLLRSNLTIGNYFVPTSGIQNQNPSAAFSLTNSQLTITATHCAIRNVVGASVSASNSSLDLTVTNATDNTYGILNSGSAASVSFSNNTHLDIGNNTAPTTAFENSSGANFTLSNSSASLSASRIALNSTDSNVTLTNASLSLNGPVAAAFFSGSTALPSLLIDPTSSLNVTSTSGNLAFGAVSGATVLIQGTLNASSGWVTDATNAHPSGSISGNGSLIIGSSATLAGTAYGNGLANGNLSISLLPGASISPGPVNVLNTPLTGGSGSFASTAGTLTLHGSQTWLNSFTYNWQANSLDNSADDLLLLNGTLTLNASASYALNLSSLVSGSASVSEWTLLTAANPILGFVPDNWSLSNQLAFKTALNLTASSLSLSLSANNLSLILTATPTPVFYWATNTPGDDYNHALTDWEQASAPGYNHPAASVFFVRDQSSPNTNITLSANVTLGNLSIGSENATNRSAWLLDGSGHTLAFNNSGEASVLTHSENALIGDEIRANITVSNNLTILALSSNTLLLNGTLTNSPATNLSLIGSVPSPTNLSLVPNLTLTSNSSTTFLNSGNALAQNITVSLSNTSPDIGNSLLNTGSDAAFTLRNASLDISKTHTGNGIHNSNGASILLDAASITVSASIYTVGNNIYNNGTGSSGANITLLNGSNLTTTSYNQAFFNTFGANLTIASGSSFTSNTVLNSGIYNCGNLLLTGPASSLNATNSGGFNALANFGSGILTVTDSASLILTSTSAVGVTLTNGYDDETHTSASLILQNRASLTSNALTLTVNGIQNSANLSISNASLSSFFSGSGSGLANIAPAYDFENPTASANLSLSNNAFLSANTSASGNALLNSGSSAYISINNSTLSANTTSADGAAFVNTASANLSLSNNAVLNAFSLNTSFNSNANALINSASISVNASSFNVRAAAGSASAHGIYNNGTSASFSLSNNARLTANASSSASAFYNSNGSFTIDHSSANLSTSGSGSNAWAFNNDGNKSTILITNGGLLNATASSTTAGGAARLYSGSLTINGSGSEFRANASSYTTNNTIDVTAGAQITVNGSGALLNASSSSIKSAIWVSGGGLLANGSSAQSTITIQNGASLNASNTAGNTALRFGGANLNLLSASFLNLFGSSDQLLYASGNFRIDGTLNNFGTGSASVFFASGNLSGTGTLNSTSSFASGFVITPGNNGIGTFSFTRPQNWSTSAFTYNWQLNRASNAHDLLNFGSNSLTLNASANAYTLNVTTTGSGSAFQNTYAWQIANASNIVSLASFNPDSFAINGASAFLTDISQSGGSLSVTANATGLWLLLSPLNLEQIYYWAPNTPGADYAHALTDWEQNSAPGYIHPAASVFFVRNQSASNTNITLSSNVSLGNLSIGSENATNRSAWLLAPSSGYANLVFDTADGSLSSLTHSANALAGDEIRANINVSNNLTILALSSNTLLLNGTLTNPLATNLSLTGSSPSPSNLSLPNLTFARTLYNFGKTALSNISVSINASTGNALYNYADASVANLTLSNASLSANSTTDHALYNYVALTGSASVLVSNSSLSANASSQTIENYSQGGTASITLNSGSIIANASSSNAIYNRSTLASASANFIVNNGSLSANALSSNGLYNYAAVGNARVILNNGSISISASNNALHNVAGCTSFTGNASILVSGGTFNVSATSNNAILNRPNGSSAASSANIIVSGGTLNATANNYAIYNTSSASGRANITVSGSGVLTANALANNALFNSASAGNASVSVLNGGSLSASASSIALFNTSVFRVSNASASFNTSSVSAPVAVVNSGSNANFTVSANASVSISSNGSHSLAATGFRNLDRANVSVSGQNTSFNITSTDTLHAFENANASLSVSSGASDKLTHSGVDGLYNAANASVSISGSNTSLIITSSASDLASWGIRNLANASVSLSNNASASLTAFGDTAIENSGNFSVSNASASIIASASAAGDQALGIHNLGVFSLNGNASVSIIASANASSLSSGQNNSATALKFSDGNFTLNDNASLTVNVSHLSPDPSDYFGGVVGIEGGGNLTLNDNASLTVNASTNGLYSSAIGISNNVACTNITVTQNASIVINALSDNTIAYWGDGDESFLTVNGNFTVNGGDVILGHDHAILGSGNLILNNARLTGSGSIGNASQALVINASASTRFAPGDPSYDSPKLNPNDSIGTLTINGPQSLTNGFTLEWQMGSSTDNSTSANDLLLFTDSLTLDATASYHILLSYNASSLSPVNPADGTTWDLIASANPIIFLNIASTTYSTAADYIAALSYDTFFNGTAEDLLSQLGNGADAGEFLLRLSADGRVIQLLYQILSGAQQYYWKTDTSGSWADASNWTDVNSDPIGSFPNAPSLDIFFTSSQQTPANGTADLNSNTHTIGEIYIDSTNAPDGFRITNGTLILENPKNLADTSIIKHYENSSPNDEIAANLILNNDLEILHTPGNALFISGNITGNPSAGDGSHDIHIGGADGITLLTAPNSNLHSGNLFLELGSLYLPSTDASFSAHTATLFPNTAIGGNGTLSANLILQAQSSAIHINDRPGAKYFDSFKINGNLTATNGFTLNLIADFSNVNVSNTPGNTGGIIGANATPANLSGNPDGNQLFNMSFASNLFLDGSLLNNAAAYYTLNITNIGDTIHITDWSLYKRGGSQVGFLLFTVTGAADAFDATHWNLLGLNVSDGWSLQWMENASGHHQLWLFYANPVRIPEPATTALLLALATALFLFHHKGRKGFLKGHKAPNPLNRS